MVDITECTETWKITSGYITNRKTNETRRVQNIDYHSIANMSLKEMLKRCEHGFNTGDWRILNKPRCWFCHLED